MTDQYLPGDHIHNTFNTRIVAASYFASLCGCLLTVEILHHRGTAVRNARSWFETLACATSMGLVGIWCMHFIGNRAIILGDGNPKIQLVYSYGFTVLSVILPLLGLTIAFSVAEIPSRTPWKHWTAVTSTGVFAGLSIVGMHYVGNLGVTNYDLNYSRRYLAASIIIAIGDCLTVLVLFYRLREKWISAWWKRTLCAMALAGGVSAMHFTASTNCDYTLKQYNTNAQISSRNVQIIVAATMCGTAALVVLLSLVIARMKKRELKRRSQKVMLASAIFDPSGRILVTTDGVLPSQEITDKYNYSTFDEEFDTAHSVFQWIFRVTRNWSAVSGLIPNMKSHLHAQTSSLDDSHTPSSRSSAVYDAETYSNYDLLFKERFCVAAASIASSLNLELPQLGVLYDKVVETGTLRVEEKANRRNTDAAERTPSEIEATLRLHLFGNGQLLFTVKKATAAETTNLLNAGLRFANVHHVGRTISHALQIPLAQAESQLAGLQRYLESLEMTEKRGTWLTFFAMIPKPHCKGFDVAVKRGRQGELPDVFLLPDQPQLWQVTFLDRFDGKSKMQITSELDNCTSKERLQPHEIQFATLLHQAIRDLTDSLPEEWVRDARFWSKQVFAHYANSPSVTTLYAFTVIGDMHAKIDTFFAITRTPKSFFEARHRCYTGSPDHAELQQRIHANFTPIYSNRKHRPSRHKKLSIPMPGGSGNPIAKLKKSYSGSYASSRRSATTYTDENSSITELIDKSCKPPESPPDIEKQRAKNFGGILVNSETVVNTDSQEDFSHHQFDTSLPMGRIANITTAKPDVTFVNQLANVTKERFWPALKGTM